MAPPDRPRDLVVDLTPPSPGPAPGAPPLPAVAQVSWEPSPVRRAGDNAPAAYVLEAGSAPGLADVATIRQDAATRTYTAPLATGTYVVRVRAANACGTSRPSGDVVVRVTGSVSPGTANPFVLLESVHALSERLADAAFIRVSGRVRNGWRAGPASFVRVSGVFDGPAGVSAERASTYANGYSARLVRSGLVTDTVLGAGEDGCFLLFARFPARQITGVRFEVEAETLAVEPLGAQVEIRDAAHEADTFGDVRATGRLVNVGTLAALRPEARVAVVDDMARVIDCVDLPAVAGTQAPAADPVLVPGASVAYAGGLDVPHGPALVLRHWAAWDDPAGAAAGRGDTRRLPPDVGAAYAAAARALATLLAADDLPPAEARVAARNALRDEARAVARRVSVR
ncbi:MAG: hypothetical protein AB7G23_03195 [Vicinamibacterales bacterium]